ncbi:hypothetical protein A3E49_03540 [Candidatus Saccharibacteria bacterium RIFCSPHIGHO2_12_FULL_49_19]|nr:MAG: hypothetical protein A2708_02670 [Candidatus Saccharibacteria bacterium RIFCSPHIGHO2_01_FULL_49_21]OGL36216.1 MAG: hypothetical protein A3E49_03540 [Candidatus Saccharibacteria bacterium RIFCSPHIGHO2_12_FULL_49_19]OGL37316.1 MAG: hypothetical protein A3B63_02065 [Candidatus Saccharibacteria bacterium RIFCSPLOWO2_01_FULL_49_22]
MSSVEKESSADSRDNRHWVDITSGDTLVGRAAIDLHIESGGHPLDIMPLAEVLDDKSIDLPKARHYREESREEVLAEAQFISSLMKKGNSAKSLRLHIARRAIALDLLASEHHIRKLGMFGSLRELQRAVGLYGVDVRNRFSHYSIEDIIDHLQKVTEEEGQKPTNNILLRRIQVEKKDEIPRRTINRKIRVNKALEHLGFLDVAFWEDHQYLNWGADYAMVNGMRLPDRPRMDILSARHHGPSAKAVRDKFGGMSSYKEAVRDTLVFRLTELESAIDEDTVHPGLFISASSVADVLVRYETYNLLESLLPHIKRGLKVELVRTGQRASDLVRAIQTFDPQLSWESIEAKARELECFYYVFPRVDYLRNLKSDSPRRPDKVLVKMGNTLMKKVVYLDYEEEYAQHAFPPGFLGEIQELEKRLSNPPPLAEMLRQLGYNGWLKLGDENGDLSLEADPADSETHG